MSAELLRRAAKVLRDAGEAATPGPWEHVDYQGNTDGPPVTFMGCGSVVTLAENVMFGDIAAPNGDLYPRSGYSPLEDMRYIALMSPPVALALADLLEAHIPLFDGLARPPRDDHEVFRLARAILREPEATS